MKILFHLGHPAHFHLFKNVIDNLKSNSHEVIIVIKTKDVLEELLKESNLEYLNILPDGRKDSLLGIAVGQIKQDIKMWNFVRRNRIDLMVGTSVVITHVGKILNIPSINIGEDDASAVPYYSYLSYPFSDAILAPISCNNGKWEKVTTHYNSYQELGYLHPNHFTPDKRIVEKYILTDRPYFIIRFSKLGAHHDKGIKGIDDNSARKIVEDLSVHGQVIINSEKKLNPFLEPFRMKINSLDMHHLLAFSQLYIGDSQTMAAEAAVLGTPSVRISDFVGKLGYLEELEYNYALTFGFKPKDINRAMKKINELLNIPNIKNTWQIRKTNMLEEKIDFCQYLTNYIENFKR